MINYDYSLSQDFNNGIDLDCLHKTLTAFEFTEQFLGLNLEGDIVSFIFMSELESGDIDSLQTIISDHTPANCEEVSDVGYGIGVAGDAESLTQSSTNSLTPIRKLRLTIHDLPSGRYRIGWYYEWSSSSKSTDFRARIQINDTTDLMYHSEESSEAGEDQVHPACGFAYQNLSDGSYDIDLDYWAEKNTSFIKNARLEIWRAA